MNGYYDPDTDERLGDILMTISDEDLKTLLMQSNGQVVLMMEDRLSYACDTKKSTWLDRMVELGSYKNQEEQTSFINYKSVRDQNDDYGDVNGGGEIGRAHV